MNSFGDFLQYVLEAVIEKKGFVPEGLAPLLKNGEETRVSMNEWIKRNKGDGDTVICRNNELYII